MANKKRPFRAFAWLRRREDIAREVDAELRLHIELTAEELMAEGMSAAAAREEAERRFGNLDEQQRECVRLGMLKLKSERRSEMMNELKQDIRYGLRMMLKKPGFAFVAVLTLALGIGANTAIFSVVNAVLLRPLPYAQPEKLVMVREARADRLANVSPPDFVDWREQNQTFEYLAAYTLANLTISGDGNPERVFSARASAEIFPIMGVTPVLGRVFSPEEDSPGKDNVALLSHELWQSRYGGDSGVTGRTIIVNKKPHNVIGVLPPGFQLLDEKIDLWVPAAYDAHELSERGMHALQVIGRLKPDVTLEQAQADMIAIARRLEEQYPEENAGHSVALFPLHEFVVKDVQSLLWVFLGAVAFVLAVACANVSNLFMARAAAREREIAIRIALGATRWRLIRQLLTESLIIATLGGAAGFLLALWGVELLRNFGPENMPRLRETAIDARVLGFTTLISLATGIVFGLFPALSVSKTDLRASLQETSARVIGGAQNRFRSLLVVSEFALALVLLIGAGLMLNSFVRLSQVNPGFDPKNVLAFTISLPLADYDESHQQAAFSEQAINRLKSLSGVVAVGATAALPLSGNSFSLSLSFPDRPPVGPKEKLGANWRAISPDYFQTMGIPLIRGRSFSEQDRADNPYVIIVNESMVRRHWPNEDPLGKRIKIGYDDITCEVVGVVGDVRHSALALDGGTEMYTPYAQTPWTRINFVVRAMADPAQMTAAIQRQVQEVDRNLPIYNVKLMEQLVADSIAETRFSMMLIGLLAAIAALLAVTGIYAVISYNAAQRTHEIGIRIALGAKTGDVLSLIIRQGMKLTLAGAAIGLTGAFALMRLLESLLFGVTPTDPMTFVIVSLLLAGVAIAACWFPARRAAKVDPMIALRYE